MLMISLIKYFTKWSNTLKTQSLIMTHFVKDSWVVLFVILALIGMCSVCWIVFISGMIPEHYNFLYIVLGLMKGTFYSGIIVDIK